MMFRSLEQQLAQKDHAQANMVDQAIDRLHGLQGEITHREREVQELSRKIKDKEMQADAALVSDKLNRHNVTKLKGEGDAKDRQITDLQDKLTACQRALDQMTMQRKSEGS